jgi:hypothetical protein
MPGFENTFVVIVRYPEDYDGEYLAASDISEAILERAPELDIELTYVEVERAKA